MASWYAAIRNEWGLIWHKPKTKVFLGLTALFPIGIGWLLERVNAAFGLGLISSGQLPLVLLSLLSSFYLPLYIFMLAADSFTVTSQHMKSFFLRPISRYKLFTAKLTVIAAMVAVHIILGFLSSSVTGWMIEGSLQGELIASNLLAYSVSLLPLWMWVTISVFISQWYKSQSSTLITLILLFALASGITYMFPAIAAFSPAHYNDWYTLWFAGVSAIFPVLQSAVCLFAAILLFFSLGLTMFERKQL